MYVEFSYLTLFLEFTHWTQTSPALDLVNDFFRFVIAFFEVIDTSAPHIYHSALPLSPQTSIIHKLYKPYAHPLARVVQGLPVSWEPIVTTIRYHDHVGRVTWSPCNRYIGVSLYPPARVVVLDAVTLKQLHTFESQGYGQWLSFSPDSRALTHFNEDHNGHITWDLQTGGQIGIIHSISPIAHSKYFSSTYSIDGKMVAVAYCPSLMLISTGISIYNLLSKTCTYSHQVTDGQICQGHSHPRLPMPDPSLCL